jgi:hypothetical protein
MATIIKFEELEIRQLARAQTNDFDWLLQNTSLAKAFELRKAVSIENISRKKNLTSSLQKH